MRLIKKSAIYRHTSICLLTIFIFLCGCVRNDLSNKDFNIILITIDALRADHLSCYGYDRKTSPQIDKIAERSIIFKNAISPSSWTAPSIASLHTAVYPTNHGVIHGIGYKKNKTIHIQECLPDTLSTLAEILKAHGYTTFGVASNLHLSDHFGFGRGFDYFKCLPFLPASCVNKTVDSWEDAMRKSDKFFLWVHYFDPHHPYHAREPWITHYTTKELTQKLKLSQKSFPELCKFIPILKEDPQACAHLIALYDSEINFVDSAVEKLIKKCALERNSLIIITSDHGEEFLDHGRLGHGHHLYQETIHVPLIVKLPHHTTKKIVGTQVNLVDIMPAILDLLTIEPPKQAVGTSCMEKANLFFWLKKTLSGEEACEDIFSELDTRSILKTIITPEWQYIYNYRNGKDQLFRITSDPLELTNLADSETREKEWLQKNLFNWVAHSKKYPSQRKRFQLSQEEKQKLNALGYLGTQKIDDDNDGILKDEDL